MSLFFNANIASYTLESNILQDWKCIISMLLDENPMIELTDVDATNLVRLLCASAKKAVGEKIVPATDNRKQYYTKAQKVSKSFFWAPFYRKDLSPLTITNNGKFILRTRLCRSAHLDSCQRRAPLNFTGSCQTNGTDTQCAAAQEKIVLK